jgi:UDP-2,4-diacetamido-2,4,6-trideoxy-beta-L-altropyranose hydrolase
MSKPVLLFRADAGNKMGTGHLVRCASLAGVLVNRFRCVLLTACTIPALIDSVRDKFEKVCLLNGNSPELEFFLKETDANKLTVLDGYHFDKSYQCLLIAEGFRLALIDDLITEPVYADAVINHCGGLLPVDFRANPDAVFALGTHYLLVNPLFQLPAGERRKKVNDSNCFVCLGGADPQNETLNIIKQLAKTQSYSQVHVVIGAAYLHRDELAAFCTGKPFISVHEAVSAPALKELMLQCSFAVCASSTIALEYLSVGGVLWVKQIADNQHHIFNFLISQKLAFAWGADAIDTEQPFEERLEKQAVFFDGKAGMRLEKFFTTWYRSAQLSVRKATENELHTSYQWANDPVVRSQSYSSQPIPLADHSSWFRKKIAAENQYYYILWEGEKAVAQIRFELSGGEATISYLTAPELRGQGMGAWILAKGIRQLLTDTKPTTIIGHVKNGNLASLRSFEKLAFQRTESTLYPDSITYTMNIYGN